jgi:hypothetical protein
MSCGRSLKGAFSAESKKAVKPERDKVGSEGETLAGGMVEALSGREYIDEWGVLEREKTLGSSVWERIGGVSSETSGKVFRADKGGD